MGDVAALRDALAALAEGQASAALPGFSVRVDTDPRVVLRGRVLTFRQAGEVTRLANQHGAGVDLQITADPASGLELAWAEAVDPDEVLELWRKPSHIGEDDARQTEHVASDGALRVLGQLPGVLLLQGRDLAIGWAAETSVRELDAAVARASWAGVRRAVEGVAVRPFGKAQEGGAAAIGSGPAPPSSGEWLRSARARLDAPYRWGGTTPRGYDCSGLAQRVFLDATGVLLPRHTSDQRRAGARVLADDRRAGDLLFATPKGQRVGHVMLLTSRDSVLHACRTEHRVIEEPLAENARRYRHQGYRRPVRFDV